jgi:VWFA-related protein
VCEHSSRKPAPLEPVVPADADRRRETMSYLPAIARRKTALAALGVLLIASQGAPAQAPAPQEAPAQSTPAPNAPAKSDAAPAAPQTAAPAEQGEVATRDNPATFRVRVNLVLARVVVRDAEGKVVQNLKKEDFLLFDNRKAQVISSFSVETPGSHVVAPTTTASDSPAAPETAETVTAPKVALPERFVAMEFDDGHLAMEDAVFVRQAATKFFEAMGPSDRVGIYTTSGQLTQEFTNDHELLKKALLGIIARPVAGAIGHDCPDVSYYQADLIENQQDTQALGVATEDALQCAFQGDRRQTAAAQSLAASAAIRAVNAGDIQTEYAYRHMEDLMRRLAGMPGQRVMVFVSPGFIPSTLRTETYEIIDRALHAGIVINTIDARGLYTPDVLGDIADPPKDTFRTAGYKASYRVSAQFANSEVLGTLADGTGGTFFHNRNDVDEGMREAGAAPALAYVLGFSPQNLKIDGRYHTIDVKLANKLKYKVQARHGYFAPKTLTDPTESAKQEVLQALYSQDEITDLSADLHTQFFKKDSTMARLAVLTHLELKGLRFRKAEGRNRNDLTVATAIFDENGNFVTGGEKIVEMRLLDATYDRLSHSGITVKSSFDVKPGTYLVRQVVRDAEGAQMAAKNGSVVIPF